MSAVVLAGGGELDVTTPAGQVLASCERVAVVTLASAFSRPEALHAKIDTWAAELGVDCRVIGAVRRADALDPATAAPVSDCDGVLVLDGSPAHLVSGLKATPLLSAIVDATNRDATVVWSGAAAAAVCDPMVDDRGGALTVGLALYSDIIVAAGWERWPRDRCRRLHLMLPPDVLFVALESGAAVRSTRAPAGDPQPSPASGWELVGGKIEARLAGRPATLPTTA